MNARLSIVLVVSMAMTTPSTHAAGNPGAGQEKAAVCFACHGPDGNSLADMWPKLAGQLPDYLVKQMQDFKGGRRSDEQMSPMAANLAEHDMPDIAAWFAAQTINPVASDKALRAKGELLYLKGKGRPTSVTACIGCHGPTGAGNKNWNKTWAKVPAVLAPGIGGQHAAYIEKQLLAYRAGTRNNDPARVMRDIARGLDDAEISALAAYIAGLVR